MVRIYLILFCCLIGTMLRAQTAQPSGSPSPSPSPLSSASPSPSPTASPQIPRDLIPNPNNVPIPTPPPAANDLLPDTRSLPATPTPGPNPADLLPQGIPIGTPTPKPKPLMEQEVKDKTRFRQILSTAKQDPVALDYWNKAVSSYTFEYRREWLREYDKQVAATMRKLEPRLKTTIDTWEKTQVVRHTQQNIKPSVPLRDLQSSSR
jgi:hypothetical protein